MFSYSHNKRNRLRESSISSLNWKDKSFDNFGTFKNISAERVYKFCL